MVSRFRLVVGFRSPSLIPTTRHTAANTNSCVNSSNRRGAGTGVLAPLLLFLSREIDRVGHSPTLACGPLSFLVGIDASGSSCISRGSSALVLGCARRYIEQGVSAGCLRWCGSSCHSTCTCAAPPHRCPRSRFLLGAPRN